MKAISLWEPWATLVAHGLKHFETRSWATNYRGSLAIHAAKRPVNPGELNATIIDALESIGYRHYNELPYGNVIGIVLLCDCEPTAEVVNRTWFKTIAATEVHFGDFAPGRFAWQLDSAQRIVDSPARGSQGFWEWTQ